MRDQDYLIRWLNELVTERTESNQRLADEIVQFGICSRRSWLVDPMKTDAKGIEAQRILKQLDDGVTLIDIAAELDKRITDQIGWLIPTNSDADADLFKIQGLIHLRERIGYVIRDAEGF